MKSRRTFLATSTLGLLTPFVKHAIPLSASTSIIENAVIRQSGEGEVFFVRENTPITIYLSKKTDNIESSSLCTEQLMPGKAIATHKHLHEDEIFHFISGSGTILIEEKVTIVSPGTIVFVPKGSWHGLQNNSTEVLFFSFGYSPAGFEDFFRQIGTQKGIPFQSKSKEEIVSLAAKFGMIYK